MTTVTPQTENAPVATPVKAQVAVAAPAPLWMELKTSRYQPSRTAWLISFIDLTSLMVAFFVLMFSMQTLEREKWEAISGSFKSKFASRDVVVESVAEGVNNAEIRTSVVRSGLGYLNVLLQQHLEKSPGWSGLRGEEKQGVRGSEMVYSIAAHTQDPQAAKAEWEALGAALRGWKNPVGVRVSAPQAHLAAAAQQAQKLALILNATGVDNAFAEVVEGEPAVHLVVRAK